MRFYDLSEPGSYARFFVEMVAMFLVVTAVALCLITAAYAEENAGKPRVQIACAYPRPAAGIDDRLGASWAHVDKPPTTCRSQPPIGS